METEEIRRFIKDSYSIEGQDVEKIKNVYRIKAKDKDYCLKVIKYDFPHFFFILSAMRHLQDSGFEGIAEFIPTVEGKLYVKIHNKFAYLTEWIIARECNYDNPLDLQNATYKLAELHLKSRNFNITLDMRPRIGWLKWFKTFETRKNEILDFKKRIENKDTLSEFDKIYLRMMDNQLSKADRALYFLSKSEYISKMKEEIKYRGFCHHDYAHHNILIDSDKRVNIIDFDYCMLDTHLHDLSSLLIRVMKNGKWDLDKALYIIEKYNDINRVYKEDIFIMAAFIEFPQDYWQVGIQYYWEKQPWGEEFFLKKLIRIEEDIVDKEYFLEDFRMLNYDGG